MDRLHKTAENLKKHGFQVQVLDKAADAKEAALQIIGDKSVGFGGSMTINSLGIYDTLLEKGNALYWHWKAASKEELPAIFKNAREADVYISSANAILESGALLNIDGNGNRVMGMFNGPKTVIIVAGENKLAGDYEDALARIKREACPGNARRLKLDTPCAHTGKCNDCSTPQRMCNITVLMERPAGFAPDVHVLLVKESLGY